MRIKGFLLFILRLLIRSIRLSVIKNTFHRIPSTRYWHLISLLLSCEKIIDYQGIKLLVNPGEVHGFYNYFFNDAPDMEVDTLLKCTKDTRIYVDVGANIGRTSLPIAKAYNRLQIYCFEPNKKTYIRLADNVKRNFALPKRVHIINKAVGDKKDVVLFNPGTPLNPEASKIIKNKFGNVYYEIPMIRLDSFFKDLEKPDTVKIDVEGEEIDVIKGMYGLFEIGFPKTLLIETHGFYYGERYKDYNFELLEELDKWNLRIHILKNSGWIPLQRPLEEQRAHLLCLNS